MAIRIVVCLDFDTDSPREAYEKCYAMLGLDDSQDYRTTKPIFEGWESTDEWFGPAGGELTETVITATRLSVLGAVDNADDPGNNKLPKEEPE